MVPDPGDEGRGLVQREGRQPTGDRNTKHLLPATPTSHRNIWGRSPTRRVVCSRPRLLPDPRVQQSTECQTGQSHKETSMGTGHGNGVRQKGRESEHGYMVTKRAGEETSSKTFPTVREFPTRAITMHHKRGALNTSDVSSDPSGGQEAPGSHWATGKPLQGCVPQAVQGQYAPHLLRCPEATPLLCPWTLPGTTSLTCFQGHTSHSAAPASRDPSCPPGSAGSHNHLQTPNLQL